MAGAGSSHGLNHLCDIPRLIEYFDYTHGQRMVYDPTILTTQVCPCRHSHTYPNLIVHQVLKERDELRQYFMTERISTGEHVKHLDTSLDLAYRKIKTAPEEVKWVRKGDEKLGKKVAPPKGPRGIKRPVAGRVGPVKKKAMPPNTCTFCGKLNHTEDHCWTKSGKCLRCGSADHQIRHCLLHTGPVGGTVRPVTKSLAKKAKKPTRMYALDAGPVNQEMSMREGTF